MSVIGFIGLGIMGQPMAANLVRAGHDVMGYNRSRPAVDNLVSHGGRAASSVAEACAAADFVITMLPDTPDVERVALGDRGVLANIRRGCTYIDMSSIRPATARHLAVVGSEFGVGVLDAPVSGGDQAATEGTLSIMVGGDDAVVQIAMPILQALGSTVIRVGPAGSGQTVKAANQLVVAGIIELVAEAIVFVEAHDVDAQAALGVLAAGLAGNQVLNRKGTAMLARRFPPGFRVDLHHKDLGIVVETARDAGVAIPLGAHVAQLMATLRAQGDGALDHTALLRLVLRLSGKSD
jgi:2-hydroxy-3-oxopropionate reductase